MRGCATEANFGWHLAALRSLQRCPLLFAVAPAVMRICYSPLPGMASTISSGHAREFNVTNPLGIMAHLQSGETLAADFNGSRVTVCGRTTG
eukprot:930189-Pyramimonas_sp.AAC.1